MIIVLNSVEGQASCTDERYLLIIAFLCKNLTKGNWRWEIWTQDQYELFNNLENMGVTEWDVNNIFTLNKQFVVSSEVRLLGERAEEVLKRALLVNNRWITITKKLLLLLTITKNCYANYHNNNKFSFLGETLLLLIRKNINSYCYK